MSDTCKGNANASSAPMPKTPIGWLDRLLDYKFCGAPATHVDLVGRPLCDRCAEELRTAMRSAAALGNALAGGRPRTEEEIARLVRPLVKPR